MNVYLETTPVEDRLHRRERELALANESLARFTYAISHDIKSPMHTLNSLLDMLSDEHREQLDDEGLELLDMILTSARRTEELVDGILNYSGSSRPIIDLENVDSRAVLDDVLSELQAKTNHTDAIITIGNMPLIQTSASILKRVFWHLINNALTYTPQENSQPKIAIGCHNTNEGVEFVFDDQGIGIDPEARDRVFGVFERLHARSQYEGAGLGLPMCVQLVNALDGRMWISSGIGDGCAFHILLPQAK